MESEKVKEIKKALECCVIHDCSDSCIFSEKHPFACLTEMHKQLLTLINELESENERLKTQLAQANAGIVNCSGCKLVEINAVNEFAEKLKERYVDENLLFDGYFKTIDELLKECLND